MSAEPFYIKQNDTAPVIVETLSLGGVVIDLTGCTVAFHLRAPDNSTKVNAAATVVNAVAGIVSYAWIGADTNTVGEYKREWEITYGSGKILTVPNDTVGYSVIITDDIA